MGIRFGVTTNRACVVPFRVIARLSLKSAALMLVALLVCVGLFLALERPAMAQTETPTPSVTPTPSATPTPSVTSTPSESDGGTGGLASNEIVTISIWLLAIAAVMVIMVLIYIYSIQMEFYKAVQALNKRGASVRTISEGTFAVTQSARNLYGRPSGSTTITIEGPEKVTTGTLSDDFSVRLDPPDANHIVTWVIEPSDMAGVIPPNGDKVKIIAAKVGKFKLRATVLADNDQSPPEPITIGQRAIDVEAVPPTSNSIELPYFGKAWGTVVLSILVAAIVAVLTLAGELSSETAGVIITALLGYLFGVAVSTKGDGSAKDEKASS